MYGEQRKKVSQPSSTPPLCWVAYCTECKEILEDCPNGNFANAVAKRHKSHRPHHDVIVGYRVELDEQP